MKDSRKIAVVAFVCMISLSCKEKNIVNSCDLSYENPIYYRKDGSEVIVKPKLSPNERGVFVSDPDGLALDPQTGEININKSATGQAYQIKYISLDNKYLCQTDLIISGIDYPDGIYNIKKQEEYIVKCFYNANIRNAAPTGTNTIYDVSGRALQNNLIIDPVTGDLKLKESIDKGLFSSLVDGAERTITFNYRINDQSNTSLNELTLNLLYYKSSARIPKEVRERLEKKQLYPGGRVVGIEGHRPPDIIVVEE